MRLPQLILKLNIEYLLPLTQKLNHYEKKLPLRLIPYFLMIFMKYGKYEKKKNDNYSLELS